jgi:hypothetical protein
LIEKKSKDLKESINSEVSNSSDLIGINRKVMVEMELI